MITQLNFRYIDLNSKYIYTISEPYLNLIKFYIPNARILTYSEHVWLYFCLIILKNNFVKGF